jgi:hypothetical protein
MLLPHPKLIAIHAAVAHVIHLSGAGKVMDKVYDRFFGEGPSSMPSGHISRNEDLAFRLALMELTPSYQWSLMAGLVLNRSSKLNLIEVRFKGRGIGETEPSGESLDFWPLTLHGIASCFDLSFSCKEILITFLDLLKFRHEPQDIIRFIFEFRNGAAALPYDHRIRRGTYFDSSRSILAHCVSYCGI